MEVRYILEEIKQKTKEGFKNKNGNRTGRRTEGIPNKEEEVQEIYLSENKWKNINLILT